MKKIIASLLACFTLSANATLMTSTSPTSDGALPSGVSEIGGIVLDIIGANGARVVTQLSASSLYVGYFNLNPGTIGTQTGFDSAVISALGGGVSELAVRLTVDDGDTAPGDFDERANFLLLNDIEMGNFSDVSTEETTSDGLSVISVSTGFGNNILSTGWFFNNDPIFLGSFYSSLLALNEVTFSLRDDRNPSDNFFDFTQGVDASLVDVGTGPITTPANPVPAPSMLLLLAISIIFVRNKRT